MAIRWSGCIIGFFCMAVLLVGCGAEQLMPTPNMYLQGDQSLFGEVPAEWRSNQVDILYVTDRKLNREDEGPAYTHERAAALRFGSCIVEIGEDISWETLVENSLNTKRELELPMRVIFVHEKGRFPKTPFPLVEVGGVLAYDPCTVAEQEWTAELLRGEIRRRLALTGRKEAYIFVHGNFSGFEPPNYVMASLWHYLGREGVPMVYTWPAGSGGTILHRYTYDRESGEFTVYHLKQFLRILADCEELEKIHVISHSQGTKVITSALRELFIETWAGGGDPLRKYKIGNLVLAAPDIELGVALQQLATARIFEGLERMTIYVSGEDKAMWAADWLFSSDRLGQLHLVDFVDAMIENAPAIRRTYVIEAQVKADILGHAYFYLNPAVSSDLILMLRYNLDPGAENGRPMKMLHPYFWLIDDNYLLPEGDE